MKSLRNKLWLALCSLLLILITISVLSIIVFTRYSHALERMFRENYNSAVYCNQMKESLDQLDQRAQKLIWQGNAAAEFDSLAAEERFESALKSELGNSSLPGEFALARGLEIGWADYRRQYQLFDQQQADRPIAYNKQLQPRYNELRLATGQIADMNMSNMVSVDGRAKQTLQTLRNTFFVLMLGGATLAGMVIWTISITLLRPLHDLTRSVREIEAGNLDLTLPLRSRDEVGRLAEAFNSMTLRLREFKQLDHDRLTRTQQTTQLAIDSLPEAVFVVGPDDRIEIANQASRLNFGIEPGKLLDELSLKWFMPLLAEVKSQQTPAQPQGYAAAIQVFVQGEEHFFLPRAVPMWSSDRRLLGVTAILIDITRLRQVDEAKSNLVSTVSHELRTPLTSQQLLLGLLITTAGPALTATQRRMLEVAKADSDRLHRTIDHLLGISRIESGRAQFQFVQISAEQIVAPAIAQFGDLFTNQQLTLIVEIPKGLPLIRADTNAMNSVVTNLLSNALKFTPPGGEVRVLVTREQSSIGFSVIDSGPGIPAEFQPRIFEKFFRVPSQSGPSGAGLGLSIAKEIIEAHQGQIEFKCPAGGGTTFHFTLPIS